jgi:hypothetical protein
MKMLLLTYKSNRESGLLLEAWKPDYPISGMGTSCSFVAIKGAAGVNEGAFPLIKRRLHDGERENHSTPKGLPRRLLDLIERKRKSRRKQEFE